MAMVPTTRPVMKRGMRSDMARTTRRVMTRVMPSPAMVPTTRQAIAERDEKTAQDPGITEEEPAMFAAALIVFRESLEAALFVGIVAAATRELAGRARWLAAGVAIGVLGAILLALSALHVGELLDGIDQDLVHIALLSVALTMLVWHCIGAGVHARQRGDEARELGASVRQGQRAPWALLIAVALAVLREGAETVLFVVGALTGSGRVLPAEIAWACALGVFFSVEAGILLYNGLSRLPTRHIFAATNALIAILAGSIASQLVKSLAQVGFLAQGTAPLWDTSAALPQDSAPGMLLHALIGYDARPSAAQFAAYVAVLLLIYGSGRIRHRTGSRAESTAPDAVRDPRVERSGGRTAALAGEVVQEQRLPHKALPRSIQGCFEFLRAQ
jgi:high-affinity iron transporter